MAEKLFDAQVNYGWGLSLNMTGKAPAVAKRIFDTYADALAYVNNVNDSAIEGLVLSVVADTDASKNGLYFVSKIAKSADQVGELVAVGSDVAADLAGLETRVKTLEDINHDDLENTIEVIKVNGVEVSPVDKVVDITIDAPVYDETIGETPSNTTAPTTSAVKTYVDAVKSNIDDIVNSLEGKVNAIETWKLEVVEANENGYPNISGEISHKTIYLVPSASHSDNNIYSEFVYIDNGEADYWEKLGEFKSDFDPTGLNTAIEGLGTRIGNIETKLANYDTLVSDVATLKSAVGDDASGLIKDVNYLKDTVDGIVSVGGEANLVNDVTVDGASIVADKIAVLNTAKSATEDEEATGGLMSKEDKVKLDSLNFEAISNDLIEQIVNGSTNA